MARLFAMSLFPDATTDSAVDGARWLAARAIELIQRLPLSLFHSFRLWEHVRDLGRQEIIWPSVSNVHAQSAGSFWNTGKACQTP